MPTDPILTTEELAKYVRASVATVNKWRWSRTGPQGMRVGRRVLYRQSDVDAWLDGRKRAAA